MKASANRSSGARSRIAANPAHGAERDGRWLWELRVAHVHRRGHRGRNVGASGQSREKGTERDACGKEGG